jgi:cytochrome bd-type quinol oxidase subunit 2
MCDLHIFAFAIIFFAFFGFMVLDTDTAIGIGILLPITVAAENEFVTFICAGITIYWIYLYLKDIRDKRR